MLEPSKYGGGPTSLICGKKKVWAVEFIHNLVVINKN